MYHLKKRLIIRCKRYDSQTGTGLLVKYKHIASPPKPLPCHRHPSSPSVIRLGCSQEKYICQVASFFFFLSVVPRSDSSGSSHLLAGFTSPLPHLITNCWEQVNTKCIIDRVFLHCHQSVWLWGAVDLSKSRVVVTQGQKKKTTVSYPQLEGCLFPYNVCPDSESVGSNYFLRENH